MGGQILIFDRCISNKKMLSATADNSNSSDEDYN
jgi:hypothetical protein